MNRIFYIIVIAAMFSLAANGQDSENKPVLSEKAQMITKLVDLDSTQLINLQIVDAAYKLKMDTALNISSDRNLSAQKLYEANKLFEWNVFENIFTEQQTTQYVMLLYGREILAQTNAYVDFLSSSGKYSQDELKTFTSEIFQYIGNIWRVRIRDRYWFERSEDSVNQLEKDKPASFVEAEAMWKAKHRGIEYQNGYKW